MNIIKTNYFLKQLNNLNKKFSKIQNDLNIFEASITNEPFSDLWNWVYKFRIKNSSIPVWKRWWFRLIVLFLDENNCIPLIIYTKNQIENISSSDIIKAKEEVLKELTKKY